jgi:hypothetical protein
VFRALFRICRSYLGGGHFTVACFSDASLTVDRILAELLEAHHKFKAATIGTNDKDNTLPRLPWSMSEGIQGKKDREQLEQEIKIESEGSSSGTAHRLQTTDSSSSSIRASKPQVGALLVEAYGKIVPKQRGFSADKVLFEYAKFLVSPINHFIFKRSP